MQPQSLQRCCVPWTRQNFLLDLQLKHTSMTFYEDRPAAKRSARHTAMQAVASLQQPDLCLQQCCLT